MRVELGVRMQHLGDAGDLRGGLRHGLRAEHQRMHLAELLRGGHRAAGRLRDRRAVVVDENENGHLQITFASLRSLSTSSATEATFLPAWRFGGSSTFSTVSRGVTSTPRSAGLTFSIGFFRAFMMLGREA